MIRLLLHTSTAALLAALIPISASAQTNDDPTSSSNASHSMYDETRPDEIVVTARKREETVKNIPTTITAMTNNQLEEVGPVIGVGDLLQSVPGVRFNGLQSENLAEVSIRGSGTGRATSADSGVGLFVNGAYVGSSTLGGRNFKRIDYFDLARVEVLEGPQGALYGRNSEFGTVNIVLNEPKFRDGGKIAATYTAEKDQLRLTGIINKQVSDTVAVRIGAQSTSQTGGLYYNPKTEKHYDHTDGYIVRGQIRYTDGPLDLKLMVDAMDMNLPTFANQFVVPAGRLPTIPQGYTGPRYDITREGKDGVQQSVSRAMLTAKYDLGWGDLTSNTMVTKTKSLQDFSTGTSLAQQAEFQRSGQIGFYPLGQFSTDARNKTFYQDLHITGESSVEGLEWLAGFEILLQENDYVRDQTSSPCVLLLNSAICGGTPTTPVCYQLTPDALDCPTSFPRAFGNHRVAPSSQESGAIYGSLKYDKGPISLSGDLRFSRDFKKAGQTDYLLYTDTIKGTPNEFTFKQDNVSYSATASYRLEGEVPALLYFNTGTGYRAGGVNNGIFNENAPNPLSTSYKNETTTSYEVGVKSDLTDNLFLRMSAYTSQTDDAIASIRDGCSLLNACRQAGTYFNINGGTVRIRGIEAALDSTIEIGDGRLLLHVNAAHQDAKFIDVPSGLSGLPIVDSPVAQSPDWTMAANANFRHPLSDDLTGFVNLAYNGQRGGGQDTVTPATPFIPLENIDNVNLRFGVDYGNTKFAFFVKNLTDEVVPVLKLQAGSIPLVNRYSQPRTSGFVVSHTW